MKRAETNHIFMIIAGIIAVVILAMVVFFLVKGDFVDRIGNLIPHPGNNESIRDEEIYGYRINEQNVAYFNAREWKDINGRIRVNSKEIDSESLRSDFEDYYYGRGEYAERYSEMGLRKVPYDVPGSGPTRTITTGEPNEDIIRDAIISGIITNNGISPSRGVVMGLMEQIGRSGSGESTSFDYVSKNFALSSLDILYVGDGQEYVVANEANEKLLAERVAMWRDSIFVVPLTIRYVDGTNEMFCVQKVVRDGEVYLVAQKRGLEEGRCTRV